MMKNIDYRDMVVILLVVLVFSLIYGMTDKFDQTKPTKPTEPQKSEVVKIMEQAPSTEKTLKENIIDLEGAVASIVAKKVSKKIPEVDIKSNVSKDGWGISLKDTRKGEYNVSVGHGKDGYEIDAVDKRDGFSINIGK